MATNPDNIEKRRKALADFKLKNRLKNLPWAKKAGVSEGSIRNFLNGDTQYLEEETYQKLAKAAGVSVNILKGEAGGVKMVGYVGAGAAIAFTPEGDPELDEVPCPPDVNPDEVVAVTVKGDSLLPMIHPGWVLYYKRSQDGVPEDCLGHLCIVKTMDGDHLVKIVQRGYLVGHYNLMNATASFASDVALEWAAPVIWIKPS